jgi:hypothetical protein
MIRRRFDNPGGGAMIQRRRDRHRAANDLRGFETALIVVGDFAVGLIAIDDRRWRHLAAESAH